MVKTEIICENCNENYIIVTKDDKDPEFCPFCGATQSIDDDSGDE